MTSVTRGSVSFFFFFWLGWLSYKDDRGNCERHEYPPLLDCLLGLVERNDILL